MSPENRGKPSGSKEKGLRRAINPVKQFEKWLLEPNGGKRKNAMEFFEAATNPERKSVYIRVLCYGDEPVKKWALKMLKKMQHEITNGDLLKIADFLNISRPEVRAYGVRALGILAPGDFTYDVLLPLLEVEKHEEVISAAIEILWSIEAENEKNRSLGGLVEMLADDNAAFRRSALVQIEKYRDLLTDSDINIIRNIFEQGDCQRQMAALTAFNIIDKPYITAPWVLSFIDDAVGRDSDVIKLAIDVLGDMRRVSEVDDRLREMFGDPDFELFREQINDILFVDTMRLVPRDAVKVKIEALKPLGIFEIAGIPKEEKTEKSGS